MARVLIVEDDCLVALHMALAIRQAGHSPVLAPDAWSAIREAEARPEMVLLDLGLPDMTGEELLRRLRRIPQTAATPVVVVTGQQGEVDRLRRDWPINVADILLKPVTAARLHRVVRMLLPAPAGDHPEESSPSPGELRRSEVIRRLIVEGPDRLAHHIYRRLCADRSHCGPPGSGEPLSWREIADWAKLEGILDEARAQVLRGETTPPASTGGEATGVALHSTHAQGQMHGRDSDR